MGRSLIMLFVSNLTDDEQQKVKKSHERILKNTGFYSKKEIAALLDEIENEKFLNLQDAISPRLYNKLYKKYFSKK